MIYCSRKNSTIATGRPPVLSLGVLTIPCSFTHRVVDPPPSRLMASRQFFHNKKAPNLCLPFIFRNFKNGDLLRTVEKGSSLQVLIIGVSGKNGTGCWRNRSYASRNHQESSQNVGVDQVVLLHVYATIQLLQPLLTIYYTSYPPAKSAPDPPPQPGTTLDLQ